jgi:hypothetical protein
MNLSIQEAQPTLLPPQPLEQCFIYIDSRTLAARWGLPETWIRDQVRRRSADPLPHIRFGKYVRFRWGSPELEAWAERRIVGSNRSNAVRAHRKDLVQ